jgi:hypothetical protein
MIIDTTGLEEWPTEYLDYPLQDSYVYAPREKRVGSDMYAGPGSTKLKTRQTIVDVSFTLQFTYGQEAYFRWWLKNKISEGTEFFMMPLHTGAGMNSQAIKFAIDGIGGSRRDGLLYYITCKAETFGHPAEALSEQFVKDLATYNTEDIEMAAEKV